MNFREGVRIRFAFGIAEQVKYVALVRVPDRTTVVSRVAGAQPSIKTVILLTQCGFYF